MTTVLLCVSTIDEERADRKADSQDAVRQTPSPEVSQSKHEAPFDKCLGRAGRVVSSCPFR